MWTLVLHTGHLVPLSSFLEPEHKPNSSRKENQTLISPVEHSPARISPLMNTLDQPLYSLQYLFVHVLNIIFLTLVLFQFLGSEFQSLFKVILMTKLTVSGYNLLFKQLWRVHTGKDAALQMCDASGAVWLYLLYACWILSCKTVTSGKSLCFFNPELHTETNV